MPSSDASPGSRPPDDATIIAREDKPGSWSGSITSLVGSGPATTAEIGRVLEGTMLGPYRLERFIGGGGMGAVFRALDTTLDRVVAVKVLAGRQAGDEEMLKRFRNEAQSAARLDHENIGRVHAVGSEDGWHFIVFEFIEGTNLRDLIRGEGPFDLARTIDVAMQVADALEHASERDVVHRDIKPSNIVITPSGRARIVDMGLARLPQVADDRDLTVSGMTLGTFDYISPEQARDPRAADVRSDLYSLGCTIFFMLTGRPPFADGTMVQKLLQHQQTPPPSLDGLRPDVPVDFADIVKRLMAKDPLDRYQRPAILVADLAAFAEERGLPVTVPKSTPSIPGPALRPRRADRLPWPLPVAGLLALVAGLWATSAWQRRGIPAADTRPGREGAAIVRVVETPRVAGDVTSLADAVRSVVDGGTIELAFDGVRREPPLAFAGKHVAIRAAGTARPTVEFTGVTKAAGGVRAACDVGDADVSFRGVTIQLGGTASPPGASLFAIGSGRLVFDDVILRMPGYPTTGSTSAFGGAAFVVVTPSAGSGPTATGLELGRTRVAGDATLLDAGLSPGGRVTLRWVDGAFISPRRLLTAAGALTDGLDVDLSLQGVDVFASEGVAFLHDAPPRATPTRLRVRASDCRFVVTDRTRPFIEQSGERDIEEYQSAVQWIDVRSRYEGGSDFRRIDAAAERMDEAVRDVVPPIAYEPNPGLLPDPATWHGTDAATR